MLSSFHVEHLEKTIRRRSLSLVRTVPGHLMRTSEAKYEFSETGRCKLRNKPEEGEKRWNYQRWIVNVP